MWICVSRHYPFSAPNIEHFQGDIIKIFLIVSPKSLSSLEIFLNNLYSGVFSSLYTENILLLINEDLLVLISRFEANKIFASK